MDVSVEQHNAIILRALKEKYCGSNFIAAKGVQERGFRVRRLKGGIKCSWMVESRENSKHSFLLLFSVGVNNHTLTDLVVSQRISQVRSSFLAHLRALEPQNINLFFAHCTPL